MMKETVERPPAIPRTVVVALILIGAWVAVHGVWVVLLSLGIEVLPELRASALSDLAYAVATVAAGLMCLARVGRGPREERVAWGLIAAGMLVWALADTYWMSALADLDEIPVPSPADAGYIALYPLVFAGLVMLIRARAGRASPGMCADAATAGLAVGAVGAAVVLEVVLDEHAERFVAAAVNLAYPVGDIALIGLVVAALSLRHWRFDRTWALLGAGLLSFTVADAAYLVMHGSGIYDDPSPFDVGWPAALVLWAAAAWSPTGRAPAGPRTNDVRTVVAPVVFALVALAVLVTSASVGELNPVAVGSATGALLAVGVRLVTAVRAHQLMLDRSRREALTDALTGLPNRRALDEDLQRCVQPPSRAEQHLLALFDLDGFKHYNDTFGHPAGDALLVAAARAWRRPSPGWAARIAWEETSSACWSISREAPRKRRPPRRARHSASAARASGSDRHVAASWCRWRPETPADALRTADRRMYAVKRRRAAELARRSTDPSPAAPGELV